MESAIYSKQYHEKHNTRQCQMKTKWQENAGKQINKNKYAYQLAIE